MAETTEERKAAVLEALQMTDGKITAALELAGVPESTYRAWRHADAAFEAQVTGVLVAFEDEVGPASPDADIQAALDVLGSQVRALDHRMTAMENAIERASVVWDMAQALVQDQRTMRALHLWAQRTVGQSRGPLPDLVKALVPEPPEAA